MINQKRDLDMVTRKIKVEIPTFHYDELEVSEITTRTSWMKLHISVLFIEGDVQITKALYKDYETGLWYYIKSDGMIISHKDTFNHTIKNLIDEMIYDCHLEMEEVAKENEETYKTEHCKSTNNDIKGHIYVDTDDTIAYQNARVKETKPTVLNVMQCMMCPADREGNRCCGEQWCKQTWKRYGAIVNPEWHHVSLATLANIDNDMLDEKRRNYMYLYNLIKDFRKYAFGIIRKDVYFETTSNVFRNIQQLYFKNVISFTTYDYAAKHIQAVGVEKGWFDSKSEETFGYKESRRYKVTLR